MIRELLQYRDLLVFLVWRDIKIRYKQTAFGAAWAILQPLLTMFVFTVFFGRLAKIDTGDVPYAIFSYTALLPWTFFAASLTNAGGSLVNNADLLTKVYFPRAVIPCATIVASLLDLVIASSLLLVLLPVYGIVPGVSILLWPLAIGMLFVLALGLSLFISAFNVAYRDVKYALPFIVQLLLFVTPVIYPTSIIPERFRALTHLNPLVGIIEACQAALLPSVEVNWTGFSISGLTTVVIFGLGIAYFRRAERSFADIV